MFENIDWTVWYKDLIKKRQQEEMSADTFEAEFNCTFIPNPESSFTVTTEDNNKIEEWDKGHQSSCEYYDDGTQASNPIGAIGGRLTYSYTPTGLGTCFVVTCACGQELNLTNVDDW